MNWTLSEINREEALRYAGIEALDAVSLPIFEKAEAEILKAMRGKDVMRIFHLSESPMEIQDCLIQLQGEGIKKHLKGCDRVAVFCATLGMDVDLCIRQAMQRSMTEGIFCDACANAGIEQVCDLICEDLSHKLGEDVYTTWRFSPGYDDFPLSEQENLLRSINAEKILGVTLGDSLLMHPLKTVTALVGISSTPREQGGISCDRCKNAQNCLYRKKGKNCGK